MALVPDDAAWPREAPAHPLAGALDNMARMPVSAAPPALTFEQESAWARAMIAVNAQGRAAEVAVAEAFAATGLDCFPRMTMEWRHNPYLPVGWVYYAELWDPDPAECGLWCLGSEDTVNRLTLAERERALEDGQLGLWRLRKNGARYRRY